jgi:hypothetical protein
MNTELGTQLRVAGLVRSPDHEGAMAHLDVDRGFALVARGVNSLSDVVDPTVWVKEKLAATLLSLEPGESPLRRAIAALRGLHGDLIRRPQRDRGWVSVLAAIFHGGEGVLLSAGDCACFRFRDGLLSRLRRPGEEVTGMVPPRGSLGSEPQVRIDVVPLRPRPGDLYVATTRQLREGELAALARELSSSRDGAELLRAGVEGSTDRGRVAIRILEAEEDASLPARAEALRRPPSESVEEDDDDSGATLDIPPLLPEYALIDESESETETTDSESESALGPPPFLLEVESVPPGVPGAVIGLESEAEAEASEPSSMFDTGVDFETIPDRDTTSGAATSTDAASAPPENADTDVADSAVGGESAIPEETRPRALAQVEDAPPWYEPLALWLGGALAIIALALLVKAILPGIIPDNGKARSGVAPVMARGVVDFFSDPPGAAVRVDGTWLEGKTPLTGAELSPGTHRIELDWGPAGTWRDTVRVTAGERMAVHPAIYGSAAFRSSDPARSLDVYLDGEYAGTTPLALERVVVGRHLVRFGGPGASTTTQSFDVQRETPAEIVGNAGPSPDTGKITIRSALLTDAGFESGKNDPIWIDGVSRGVTPFSLPVKPGAHSVRVVRRGYPAQVTVVDVKAGGDHYVTAEFGARSEQPLQFMPPSSISISNPLPVTVSLPEGDWDPSVVAWCYAATPDGSFQAKRMTKLEGGDRVFATLVPPEVMNNRLGRVRVYFKASGADGRELYSEIVTIPVRP